jgi:hypothetical protein
MKKILISAGALAALAISTPALASNTAQSSATVNIVSPLSLVNNAGLNFGTVIGPFNGEVVEVSAAGGRTCPATLTCSGNVAVSAATFTATGTASQNLAITADATATLSSGLNNLTVDLSTDLPTGVATDTTGKANFGVGGSLTIPANTPDGSYTGTFNVTAQYQ